QDREPRLARQLHLIAFRQQLGQRFRRLDEHLAQRCESSTVLTEPEKLAVRNCSQGRGAHALSLSPDERDSRLCSERVRWQSDGALNGGKGLVRTVLGGTGLQEISADSAPPQASSE